MKKIVLGLAILFSFFGFAQEGDHFLVEGQVFYKGEPIEQVVLQLYDENQLIKEYTTDEDGYFSILLWEDKHYSMKVKAEDYIEKLVQIKTDMLGEHSVHKKEHPLNFNIHLVHPKKHVDESVMEELEFPSAILKYNEDSKSFVWDDKYIAEMEQLGHKVGH